jgi:hypothetical protein
MSRAQSMREALSCTETAMKDIAALNADVARPGSR